MHRIGLVVHPSRNVDGAIRRLRTWADGHGVETVQVAIPGQGRRVAEKRDAADCDLLVAVGGDGTMLAATHAAALADRPVLGVACGSLGVLTSVAAGQVAGALDRFVAGDWTAKTLPALRAERADAEPALAFNDIVIARHGLGQVRITVTADGVLFNRFAGDGCIVSTPAGSSGYTLAAGGPLLARDVAAFVITPLNAHGGFRPPLVIGASSQLEVAATPGFGGARLEIDGQVSDVPIGSLTLRLVESAVSVVTFADQLPVLTALRGKRILTDSPRIVAEDLRSDSSAG
jgi:NAD+ kinase